MADKILDINGLEYYDELIQQRFVEINQTIGNINTILATLTTPSSNS